MRRWIRWAVGICACPAVAAPAGGTAQDGQQWSTVSVDHNVSPNISASLALRLRLDDDVSRKKDLTVRPAISLAGPADLKLGLGFDYLYSFPDSESSEYRPGSELWFSWNPRHASASDPESPCRRRSACAVGPSAMWLARANKPEPPNENR